MRLVVGGTVGKQTLIGAIWAILIRLPLGFLVPFAILFLAWTFFAYKAVTDYIALRARIPQLFSDYPGLNKLDEVLVATLHVFIFLLGILLAYNVAVLVNWALVWSRLKLASIGTSSLPATPQRLEPGSNSRNHLARFQNIGIVLAGGGAKGAFQAGAMRAIYQYLADNDALEQVKVIAGTSIGSWNALFWLTDLIACSDKKQLGAHELWWRSISLRSLISPSWYFPCLRNAFFVTEPWQRTFDDYFGQPELKRKLAETKIQYFFTSCHVSKGQITCVTNSTKYTAKYLAARHIREMDFHLIDPSTSADEILADIKFGVFSSMDLPPLFPYMRKGDEYYEDGGVIDNLPLMFAGMEDCDLVFVLPLNSDFVADPNHRSVLNRFLRVMDVRQGALERASFKNFYLYNELAMLRKYARELESRMKAGNMALPTMSSKTLQRALDRTNTITRIFAICPHRSFVEETINTQELWKKAQAATAFKTMKDAAEKALEEFDPEDELVKLWLVSKGGKSFSTDDIF